MKILCVKTTQPQIPASQQVNRIGKYLYKHLDGAYHYHKSGNMYDVYCTLLYELKEECGGTKNDVQEMTIDINITTYQNKLRINTIEMTPQERMLGFDLIKPEELADLQQAMKNITQKVHNRVCKVYKDYIVIF